MASFRDYVALTKPGITRMCLLMCAGGLLMAPGDRELLNVLAALVGSSAVVGGANALNMWWERRTDRLMSRTRRRPLPAGRMAPESALKFGVLISALGLGVLAAGTNAMTVLVAALALGSYVLIYTPLKYVTPMALLIGAVPGAAPPLLGWTAATGSLDAGGLVLFAILLIWQMPHFLAIALFRKQEYANAGIRCVPVHRSDAVAKIQAVMWATILVPTSMLLTPLGVTGGLYAVCALFLGLAFSAWSYTGLRNDAGRDWARGFFMASLVYLPALTGALVLDVVLR